MRDLIVAAFIFGSIPFILRSPFYGMLMWVFVGILNPHRLTYGFAYSMPFAQIVAVCVLLSLLFNRKQLTRFPIDRVSILLIMLTLWIGVSSLFSFHPDKELEKWLTPVKVLFMTLVAMVVMSKRDHLHKLAWVLAFSVGFYGIKGGLFTVITAGSYRVWGPAGSFIEDNNALALATIITIPLFRYLQLHSPNLWVRHGCIMAMVLCVFSVLGSHSRGAFLAMASMGFFLFFKSRQKGLILVLLAVLAPVAFSFMPEQWWERMATIKTYDQDSSAMERINSWWTAWNLAVDRFPIGGGFAMWEPDVFQRYAPDPSRIFVAHSIYFQVLGEHGFIGLLLYLLILLFSWMNAGWVIHHSRARAGWNWAYDLASMCQVSLAGYMVGGAFLSLLYFDLPYYIMVILILLRSLLKHEIAQAKRATSLAVPA